RPLGGSSMTCPRCQHENRAAAKFCEECGASLSASAGSRHKASVDPILNPIAKTAARLCEARDAQIFLAEGGTLRLVAQYGTHPATFGLNEPHPLNTGTPHGQAVLEGRVVHVRDMKVAVRTRYAEMQSRQRAIGLRTLLAAPLLSNGT